MREYIYTHTPPFEFQKPFFDKDLDRMLSRHGVDQGVRVKIPLID